MEKALGFYPRDAGSIPAGGTIIYDKHIYKSITKTTEILQEKRTKYILYQRYRTDIQNNTRPTILCAKLGKIMRLTLIQRLLQIQSYYYRNRALIPTPHHEGFVFRTSINQIETEINYIR